MMRRSSSARSRIPILCGAIHDGSGRTGLLWRGVARAGRSVGHEGGGGYSSVGAGAGAAREGKRETQKQRRDRETETERGLGPDRDRRWTGDGRRMEGCRGPGLSTDSVVLSGGDVL